MHLKRGLFLLVIFSHCRTTTTAPKEDLAQIKQASGNDLSEVAQYEGPPLYKYQKDGSIKSSAPLKGQANTKLWNRYCKGKIDSLFGPPEPNYENEEVKQAAKVLSQQAEHSFSLYWPINRHYSAPPSAAPTGIPKHAHQFLIYLCGEFRDRATMIEAKIGWVNRTNYLPLGTQGEINPKKSPWLQMSAELYAPYLQFSADLFAARSAEVVANKGTVTFGSLSNIDRPVPAQLVCETKYIFAEFLDKAETRQFPGLPAFSAGYEAFRNKYCTQEDLDFYYNFRGDGNFKPNSPESNGMIWHSISVATQCKYKNKAKTAAEMKEEARDGGEPKVLLNDQDCEAYFKNPFAYRWGAARAGLGSWMLYDEAHEPYMSASANRSVVIPEWRKRPQDGPFRVMDANNQELSYFQDWQKRWLSQDLGLATMSAEGIYKRLRNAVNRHTDWYASGYDDLMNQGRERDEAYSPFVASSYEMSMSDEFVSPCYTIPCPTANPAQNWKHYMFVFRVHKSHWFNTDTLEAGGRPDFDSMWFDETSFGTTDLAKSERAFDRLGTALEHEFDSILYLHNICSNGSLESDSNKCDL